MCRRDKVHTRARPQTFLKSTAKDRTAIGEYREHRVATIATPTSALDKKLTSTGPSRMSAKCQKQTFCPTFDFRYWCFSEPLARRDRHHAGLCTSLHKRR